MIRIFAISFIAFATTVPAADFGRQQVADVAYKSVCRVKAPGGIGTGCYLSNRWVLTAGHVVEGETDVVCEFRDCRIKAAEIVCDVDHDVALVKLASNPNVPEQEIGVPGVCDGDVLTLAGFDRGRPNALRVFDGELFAVYTGHINIRGRQSRISIPGNSGGPVWNASGRIISVISTRCPVGTAERDAVTGRIVGYTKVGVTGAPNPKHVIGFIKRVMK